MIKTLQFMDVHSGLLPIASQTYVATLYDRVEPGARPNREPKYWLVSFMLHYVTVMYVYVTCTSMLMGGGGR